MIMISPPFPYWKMMNVAFFATYLQFPESIPSMSPLRGKRNQADVLEVLLREQIQVGNKGSNFAHVFGANSTIVTTFVLRKIDLPVTFM